MICPICNKRKPERFCPAKGEKICAPCCGTEREVTIDCPSDCSYLIAARRYEAEHRKPPLPDPSLFSLIEISRDLVEERREVVTGLGYVILKFAGENRSLVDGEAHEALHALAETYRTLLSGIYYERPPDAPLPRDLYQQLAKFLEEYRQAESQRAGFTSLKDSEAFHLLVFLLRLGRRRSNGRPRSRAFLDFLRSQLPKKAPGTREAPRIILP